MIAFVTARWNGLSPFWQAQIGGWGLFAIADVLAQRVAYHSFTVAFARTGLIVLCLVTFSIGLRGIYASPLFARRVSIPGVALIGLLSALGGLITASMIVLVHEMLPWIVPPDRRGVRSCITSLPSRDGASPTSGCARNWRNRRSTAGGCARRPRP